MTEFLTLFITKQEKQPEETHVKSGNMKVEKGRHLSFE